MTKQEVMAQIDQLRDLMSKEGVGLIDLRRGAERRFGADSLEYRQCRKACDDVEKIIERMLFGVYHRMGPMDLACSCGQAFQTIQIPDGWHCQGLAEDVEMPDGTWKVKLHNLSEPCELRDY